MNAEVVATTATATTATVDDGPSLARADRLAEVLLPELVRTLGAEGEPGTVLGGRPHLRLFGEAIDLALPLRALRRLSEAACGSSLHIDDDTLERHAWATRADDGYLVSAAGMYAARGRGSGSDDGVRADTMSLRLYTSSFCYPMNALLRADPARPETWLAVVAGLRGAAQRYLERERLPAEHPFARRMARLRANLVDLTRLEDPRLPRLLGEQLVHALMATRALGRQRPYERDGEQPDRLFRVCALPEAALADLRWAAAGEGGGVWRDPGLLSTSPREAQSRWFGRAEHPHMLEVRPLFRSSAGRWLDGAVEDVQSHERQVLFPPGTPFEVVEVVEAPRREGGPPRVTARLVELSPRVGALRSREGRRAPARAVARPLYHYTVGRALLGIVDDGEIGVAALPGTDAPVVWLSTRASFEPSVVASVIEDGRRRELSVDELAERGQGLFRIEVDPAVEPMPWREYVAWAEVPDEAVSHLERIARERGADPDDWYCCATAVPRSRWKGLELAHPLQGWIPVEP
jgi:hypothetical protein